MGMEGKDDARFPHWASGRVVVSHRHLGRTWGKGEFEGRVHESPFRHPELEVSMGHVGENQKIAGNVHRGLRGLSF